MPCKECENGLWRWGESGECRYDTLEDCEKDNADYYLEETFKPESDKPIDFTYNFTQDQMEELHTNGELIVEVESDEGESMVILYTYNIEDIETEELEEAYEELTASMLDDELDDYIDKLTDSIKKL